MEHVELKNLICFSYFLANICYQFGLPQGGASASPHSLRLSQDQLQWAIRMKSRTNREKESGGAKKKRPAAEAAEAKRQAFLAKNRARKKADVLEKKARRAERAEAAHQAGLEESEVNLTKREKAIAKQLAQDFVAKGGHLSHSRQAAFLWSLIGQPVLHL
jgi:hypothetical protein